MYVIKPNIRELLFLLVKVELLLDLRLYIVTCGENITILLHAVPLIFSLRLMIIQELFPIWVFHLFDKIEVLKMFCSFFSMIEMQFDTKIKWYVVLMVHA